MTSPALHSPAQRSPAQQPAASPEAAASGCASARKASRCTFSGRASSSRARAAYCALTRGSSSGSCSSSGFPQRCCRQLPSASSPRRCRRPPRCFSARRAGCGGVSRLWSSSHQTGTCSGSGRAAAAPQRSSAQLSAQSCAAGGAAGWQVRHKAGHAGSVGQKRGGSIRGAPHLVAGLPQRGPVVRQLPRPAQQ